jgi:hypothetical protein
VTVADILGHYNTGIMNDPHIKAFTILSDRVSTLEEMLTVLTKRERWKENTAIGPLDHAFLGFPFEIWRWPRGKRGEDEGPLQRQEGVVPAMVPAVIIALSDEVEWPHGEQCADSAFFPASEIRIPMVPKRPACAKCHKVGVDSHLIYLCHESVARKLKYLVKDESRLTDVDVLEDSNSGAVIRLEAASDMWVDDLLHLAFTLIRRLQVDVSALQRVDVYPCNRTLFQGFRNIMMHPLPPGYNRGIIGELLAGHSFYQQFFEGDDED